MFKKYRALKKKNKELKNQENARNIHMYSHILIVLYNNLMKLNNISTEEKQHTYEQYTLTLYNSMTDYNKILFLKAMQDANQKMSILYTQMSILYTQQKESNEMQIKRQLDQIFDEVSKK